jgi:hypothetical protein
MKRLTPLIAAGSKTSHAALAIAEGCTWVTRRDFARFAPHAPLPGSTRMIFKSSSEFPQLGHPEDFTESTIFILC